LRRFHTESRGRTATTRSTEPAPFDFDAGRGLDVYHIRAPEWRTWESVRTQTGRIAARLLTAYARER